MNENVQNGLSQLHTKQSDFTSRHFNGLGSSNSSRDTSPSTRLQQIPTSQLPPSRTAIPASQLPPTRPQTANIQHLTKNYANLNVSGLTTNLTPFSSPKVPMFNTSTPVIDNKERESTTGAGDAPATNITKNILSPITSSITITTTGKVENKEQTTKTFTHSATSQFTNVTSNSLIDSNNESLTGKKDILASKSDQKTQRTFDSNLFTTSMGPTLSSAKSIEHLSNNAAINNASKVLHPNEIPQNQGTASINQNLTTQIKPSEQPQISQQNYQPPTGVNQNAPFQQAHQINNNLSSNFMNMPSNTIPPHQTQIISNQTGLQNLPQNQINAINRPKLQTTLPQPRPNMPTMLSQPAEMHYQNRQMAPNNMQNAPNYGPAPPVQRPNLPPNHQNVLQASLQIPPHSVAGQVNQNLPPQLNQNLPQSGVQNQTRAHLHSNRYPVGPSQSLQNLQPQQLQQPPPPQYANQQPSQYTNQQPSQYTNQQPSQYTNQQSPQYAQQQPSQYTNQQPPQFGNQHPPQFGNQQSSQYTNQQFQYSNTQQMQQNYGAQQTRPSVTQHGFNKLWGRENFDLLQAPNILPQTKIEPPKVTLGQEFLDAINCNPDIFRCTITKIPETTSLLQKSRLPLGVLIHPFKDLNHLPVIQCNTIVRCRACRTYINPFVFFADSKRWKCNLCYRINDLPDEFQFDPVTKTYGDPSRRPEVKSSTIEYIAPAEYMLRPPQPAVYLFLLDVSRLAIETGYLHTVCNILSSELTNLPGDARTQIGFLAYDSALHFFALSDGQNQPHEMTVLDIDDVFLPCPDNLLVNLQDRMEMITDLLTQLPTRYLNTYDTNSALGSALQVGYKMMSATGGRITVFQASLPNVGPGALTSREDPNQRASSNVAHLNPANDFYKRLALECSGQQIAVDLFILNSQYVDIATISGISRFSGGCIHHFPLFKASRILQNDAFEKTFRRYVTRKIGFEAVMRIRCTRGLSIHTFHGNFFVRSTDLLSLPNINPDAGFGMQVSIEENLTDVQTVCFQAALLYTSSKGERRIRVHTMCLPVANNLTDVINAADQQCIVGLLSKMAVDRSMQSSLADAREAFINVAIDILSSYKLSLNMASGVSGLMAPDCLKLLPLYISALLKNTAFRIGISTRLDDRVKAMCDMKTKPLPYLMQMIYPDLYPIHNLQECSVFVTEDDETIHQPPHLQLTARSLDSHGAYLLDTGEHMILFVCANVSSTFLNDVLDVPDFSSLSDDYYELPILENPHSKRVHSFVNFLNDEKPFQATIQVIRENSPNRVLFYERLIEDRLENSLSYHEFIQHIKTQVK